MSDDVVHLQTSLSLPRTKPAPNPSKIPLVFSYTSSDDGTDENLLILLHGLVIHPSQSSVDLSVFRKPLLWHYVPRSSKPLPFRTCLATLKPKLYRIPYLYEQAFQWYTSFDLLGDIILRPNPSSAIEVMTNVLDHLVEACTWPPNRIHLFGFGQGGSVAAESALAWWKKTLSGTKSLVSNLEQTSAPSRQLGSVVSISGPLLSYPTLTTLCPTPLALFWRSSIAKDVSTTFSKGFLNVKQVVKPGTQGEESMPRSRDEWEPIMEFWGQVLGKRIGEGLYEVITGSA